jgi:molybdenum cofactor cytidylyltransferase
MRPPQNPGITGIVLAAGESRRMGRPKALLPFSPSETFIAHIARTLRAGGLDDLVVVGRIHDEALRQAVADLAPAAVYAANPNPERGQLSSLLIGIDQAEQRGARCVLVMPVDIPAVTVATVAALVAAGSTGATPIVRANHDGRHGHPVLFMRELFPELRAADPALGAKAVLRAHADRILEIEVDDPGVLRDVDWPADYLSLFGREP